MEFSHFNKDGNAYMVNVSEKNKTKREARAFGKIKVSKEVISQLINHQIKRGKF